MHIWQPRKSDAMPIVLGQINGVRYQSLNSSAQVMEISNAKAPIL